MIELPDFAGHADALWTALLDLGDEVSSEWVLVGGQMVLLHGELSAVFASSRLTCSATRGTEEQTTAVRAAHGASSPTGRGARLGVRRRRGIGGSRFG